MPPTLDPPDSNEELKSLKTAKAALRDRLVRARRGRAAADPAGDASASAAIQDRLEALPEVRGAALVASYAAIAGEVDLDALQARLGARGARVAYPRTGVRPAMEMIEVASPAALVPGRMGLREPAAGAAAVSPRRIDVVLVPGVAFDRAGGRLGRGAGYYDTYLPRLRAEAARIGVAFADQIVADVPVGAGDLRVDWVVTQDEVIDCRDGRGQAEAKGGTRGPST
jgi:5-formyltetrahydrofolate cyclo-ligase